MARIGFGIVGTGWIARRLGHTLKALEGAGLAAVSSRDRARAEAFRAEFGGARAYGGLDDLLGDPAVDVVYIATPHPSHHAMALVALDAGKPVISEKPFAMTGAEARAMAQKAAERNLFCMEALWTLFLPLYRNLGTVMAGAGLGAPSVLRAEFGRAVEFDPAGRFYDPAQGGGSLLDMGVYGVAVANRLFGEPTAVHSAATIGATGVDEQCAVTLSYPTGEAYIASSLNAPLANDLRVFCGQGGFRVHPVFIEAERLDLWRSSGEPVPDLTRADGSIRWPAPPADPGLLNRLRGKGTAPAPAAAGVTALEFPALPNRHAHQLLEVMRCLREGLTESPVLPLSESVRLMETLDRIRAAWPERLA